MSNTIPTVTRLLFLLVLMVGLPGQLAAQGPQGAVMPLEFDSPDQRARYQQLSEVLRCPMCQNQNLSGSNAGIAGDLRRELHRLIMEGQSNQEILDFMQSRYGNFILYDPPLDRQTVLLWLAPALLLGVGLAFIWRIGRKRSGTAMELDDESRARARRLLEQTSARSGSE